LILRSLPELSLGEREIERHKRSNLNAVHHVEAFANHRRHLTALSLPRSQLDSSRTRQMGPRLCVLGAGSCCDLDLERLAESYDSIHLVDVDEQALEHARDRQAQSTRARLVTHGRTDLSGALARLERWRNMRVTPEELLEHPELTSADIAARLGGPFSTVLSACVLSQMQLSVRMTLSDTHPLFEAVCYTVTLTHLRTLARLTEPGGRAVFATDIASEQMAPLRELDERADLHQLLARLSQSRDVFNVVTPDVITSIARDDPNLGRELDLGRLADVWLWHNGPQQIFLVYALELARLGSPGIR
jgi:hypothetical protein